MADIGEKRGSGLETISETSAASTDDMSIITSGLRSEVSDEFGFLYQPVFRVSGHMAIGRCILLGGGDNYRQCAIEGEGGDSCVSKFSK